MAESTLREIGAAVMLGIVARACASIRHRANVYLNLGGTERYWIDRDDLIMLETLGRAADRDGSLVLAGVAIQMRDALVTVSGSSEGGWCFLCVACHGTGDPQAFRHRDGCPALLWDLYTTGRGD